MMQTIAPIDPRRDVLVVVDIQNDFCPGGALAIRDGDEVIGPVNALVRRFEHVVLTQDWHPADHGSFASSHAGRRPFETIELDYGPQTLWPDHCVQGTHGAAFHPRLEATRAELVIRKGYHRGIDSYSAFHENDHATPTGLAGYLRERGFSRVFLCGLATDYCVAWSATDARHVGFETVVLLDASRAIDLEGSLDRALQSMREADAVLATSAALG